MSSSTIPIPPPPPPPTLQRTTKTLAPSERPPANRNGVGSIRSTENSSSRSILANIHPETLQHAAANLRKTQHSQSLFTPQSEQLLGRSTELSFGGYRPDLSKHDQLEFNQTGTPIHASYSSSNTSMPIGNGSISSNSIKSSTPPSSSSSTSKWTTSYGQPLSFNKPNISSSNNNNNYSTYSSSSTTTYSPQQQPPPQTSTLSYTFSSNDVAPPDYPPPPPPPSTYPGEEPFAKPSSTTNFYSSSTSSANPSTNLPQQYQNSHNYSSTSSSTNPPTNFYASSTIPSANLQQQQHQSSHNYISNPQSYIHEFATKTPVAEIDPTIINENNIKTTTPVNSRTKQYSYAEQLRDSSLTDRQKFANQFQRSNLPERLPPQAVAHIYQESTAETEKQLSQRRQQQQQQQSQNFHPSSTSQTSSKIDEVDELIKTMEWKMRTGNDYDICSKCQKEIVGDTPGVTALGKPYHVTCFCCDQCQKQLAGCSFYSVDGKNLCQVDYMNSLDKCDKCATPITQKILRAMGKAFHPECFACPSCTKSLDGIPFTVDPQGTPYCLECYHERFSPRCAVCLKAIVPQPGETEVARIVAMDRSYHLACYKCEECGMQLNSKIEGQGCYPIDTHLFCKNCNINKIRNKH